MACRTAQVAEEIWAQTFKYLADNKVLFEGMLLKPSMVTPGADSGKKVWRSTAMLLHACGLLMLFAHLKLTLDIDVWRKGLRANCCSS